MAISIGDWRARIKHRLRQQLPPGSRFDLEAQEQFDAIINLPVPSDDELIAMQKRGELPSDEELARDRRP